MAVLTVPALGSGALWTLGVAVKGAVVLVVVLAVATALPRASAGLRHLLWSAGVVAVLVLPPASLLVPWELPLIPTPSGMSVRAPGIPVAQAPPPADAAEGFRSPSPGTQEAAFVAQRSALAEARALSWLFVAWGVGTLVLLMRLGLGTLFLRRVTRDATPLASPDWIRPLIEGANLLGVTRLPRLVMSDRMLMPVVSRVLDPTIVLPTAAVEWAEDRRRAVLCHELSHIRRLDLATNLLCRWACALYWFNPLVWVAARRVREESERACDDLVLSVGTRPSDYAEHLLQIVRGARRSRTPAVAVPMAQRREFEGRMLAILDESAGRAAPSRRHVAGSAVMVAALLLPITITGLAPPASAADGGVAVSRAGDLRSREIDPSTLAALLGGLEKTQPRQRVEAANALGTMKARGGGAALGLHLLRDPDAGVRLTAAWALGQIATVEGVDPLTESALGDGTAPVRAMAAWALGQIASPTSVTKLATALDDASADVRLRAAWAIGHTAPDRAPAALVRLLQDPDTAVVVMAAWALGRIRDPSAIPALEDLARHGEDLTGPSVEALWALAAIGGEAVREPLTRALDRNITDQKLKQGIRTALAGGTVQVHGDDWPIPAPTNPF